MKNQKMMMSAAILSAALWSCGGTTNTTDGGSKTDAGVAATCDTYCTTILANCSAGVAQYKDKDTCMGACSGMTPGTVGATSGNSLECRAYHSKAAAMDATTHCPHAGPAGDGASNCGANCESFCSLAMAKCAGTFSNLTECTTECALLAGNTDHYNSGLTSGNTFGCRMYHLSVASTSDALKTVHCPHIRAANNTCM